MRRTRSSTWLLLLLLAGCGQVKNSDRLLSDALSAGNAIAAYYDDTARVALERWQAQSVYNAYLQLDPPDGKKYNESLLAVRTRADLAPALVTACQKLQPLPNPNGVARLIIAGQDLGKAVSGIPELPGAIATATGELGSASEALATLERERDLKRALVAATKLFVGFSAMFVAEAPTYRHAGSVGLQTVSHSGALTRGRSNS